MKLATLVLLFLAAAQFSFAQDKATPLIDGTWTWTYKTKEGKDVQASIKLKQEGEKLTGAYLARDGKETPIENAQINGPDFSFDVTREIGGNKMLFKYTGKVAGDNITGKILFGKDKPTPHEWEAKRAKN